MPLTPRFTISHLQLHTQYQLPTMLPTSPTNTQTHQSTVCASRTAEPPIIITQHNASPQTSQQPHIQTPYNNSQHHIISGPGTEQTQQTRRIRGSAVYCVTVGYGSSVYFHGTGWIAGEEEKEKERRDAHHHHQSLIITITTATNIRPPPPEFESDIPTTNPFNRSPGHRISSATTFYQPISTPTSTATAMTGTTAETGYPHPPIPNVSYTIPRRQPHTPYF
ncbi:hypothetical protein EX30DRAFT_55180 [Ascodesmis nigricans]|uniref:Uncharacterized protein n=1 Tax=Ascodesmis nigricans TaxID=341454 RepID=A0A4S2MVH9_9PEZI|nr:hypothetical protein EX30DRAFT_55180 [Ascodesmis nigricans]